ncbi:hypothetical protein CCACVL1_26998 [Corchorus capsularis]|uniref:Uncharacterized protein n=1 Tax=Corchorus capsularis TaxID=210143 RepID=A0A1R3GCH3_COCAP|nr:hypothetical protein CCACVL1_26998 [Corchorus capsularis]
MELAERSQSLLLPATTKLTIGGQLERCYC